ncbi:alpha/beta hydrolase fold protein [Rippkaea orientalis PCC 8801]|uniref:Alpha/beta hydrolase fold protein n=1 Tax=Rippkaea orientalis (strain PCC 8801 / RF-1) TaxID=41431 RepID=B7JWW2_RIPO1|nr:alpha/beta hydrolase [Rippkaea orientalis]ACK65811.1 alpha/beta hydrolase fold protein [Rippkaea orientalis PCC 8801]
MVSLPLDSNNLTENTSINLLKQIVCDFIVTPLSPEPIPTAYVCQGTGQTPILLLHGFDSSLLEFRRLVPLLAEHHTTWTLDLLGFGFTQRLTNLSFSPQEIKTHLYCFWKTLIQEPVILVGASMGGATAIDFTLTYPEAVKKMVLIDSAGLTNPPLLGKFMFPPLDSFATSFLRNPTVRQKISQTAYYNKKLANLDAQLCAALHLQCPNWNKALIAFTKSGGYGSFKRQLPQLNPETLIIWGQNDQILGTKDATVFKELIPNSQLKWVPNCGHVPHLEQPEITQQLITTSF